MRTMVNHNFPPYAYQPYPRWVQGLDGKPVLVENEEGELAILEALTAADIVADGGDTDNALLPARKPGWPLGKPRKPRPEGE